MSVRRFGLALAPYSDDDRYEMRPEPDGDYVRSEDYDALREAAGKVTCWRCEGFGELKSPYEEGAGMDDADPCPDCTDLRKLLEVGHE